MLSLVKVDDDRPKTDLGGRTRRVTPARCFFLSDGQDEYAVHGQRCNCRSTMRGQTHERDTFPLEVRMPVVLTWVIENDFFSAVRIKCGLPCSFTKRT